LFIDCSAAAEYRGHCEFPGRVRLVAVAVAPQDVVAVAVTAVAAAVSLVLDQAFEIL
jgi:hypothetical protein